MIPIEYIKGTVFAKKVGDKVQIFEGGSVGDESLVLATGTTMPRMPKDRFADMVNVRDFGAKGDGVTDDTEAIQAALQANFDRDGGTVFVPAGTYVLTDTLYLGGNTNFVLGDGVTLKRGAAYTAMFANCLGETWQQFYNRNSSGYTGHSNIRIVGGTIDGNTRTFGVQTHLNGFAFYDTHDVVVEGVTFKDWGHNHQIEFGAAKNCKVLNCTFKGMAWETEVTSVPECIQLDRRSLTSTSPFYPNDGIEVAGCWFGPDTSDVSGAVGGPPPLAVGSHSPSLAKNVSIHDNTIIGAKYGILLLSYDGVSVYSNRIINADIGIYWGAYIWDAENLPDDSIGAGCKNVQIIGNYINAKHYGIYMTGRNADATRGNVWTYYNEHVLIQNNIIAGNCDIAGIQLFASKNAVISGNSISVSKIVMNIRDSKVACVSNNYFLNNDYLYQILLSSILGNEDEDYWCENITFVGNYFQNTFESEASVYAIWAERSKRLNVIGNSFNLPASSNEAVKADSLSKNTFASGNINAGSSTSKVVQSLAADTNTPGLNYGFNPYNYDYKLADCGPLSITQAAGKSSLHFNRVGYNNVTVLSDGTSSTGIAFRGVTASGQLSEKGFWMNMAAGGFLPYTSGQQSLGYSDRLWSELYASTGTINTSDYRCKQNIANPTQALLKAWGNVGFKVFQFKDAVEKKGDSSARYHVGVIAQDVQSAFSAQGLDASKYGLFCHDSWKDEYETIEVVDQPEALNEAGEVVTPAVVHTEQRKVLDAGDRYGVRYEEALALECAYLRDRLSKIETALATHGITLGDEQ